MFRKMNLIEVQNEISIFYLAKRSTQISLINQLS